MNDLSAGELDTVTAFLTSRGISLAGPLTSTLIASGRSNLTFRLDDGHAQWALRMPPRAGRTPTAHDVAREYRVTSALYATGVPVPRAVGLCEDESVIGVPFAIWQFVPGCTIQSRDQLDALDAETVAALSSAVVGALADLHRVDYLAVGLEGFGRPGSYAQRQVRRWRSQWEIVATGRLRSLGAAIGTRLADSVPDHDTRAIVHGDFRIDNTLVTLDGTGTSPRVAAVVDWELSTIGDPVADVAIMCAYRDPAFDLIVGVPAAWTSSRLPSAEQLAAAYTAAGGVTLRHWEFHMALAYFKIGVIAAGISHRARVGAISGTGFDTAGDSVPRYLELAAAALGTRP